MPDPWFWLYLPLHLMMTFISLIYFTFEGQGAVIWRAKIDALRGLPAAIGKRAGIQRQRQVSTSEIRRTMTKRLTAPWEQMIAGRRSAGN
jgi:hypothetical protein